MITQDSVHVVPLWVTPLYITSIDSASSYIEKLNNIGWERFSTDNGYITNDTYVLNRPEFFSLQEDINAHINNYVTDVFKIKEDIEFYITNSWGTKHNENDWANKHYHTNSLFSGVLYLNCDKESGDITFHKNIGYNTGIPHCFDFEYTENNMFNSTETVINPETNMLLLFPSSLEHSVGPCNSHKDRIVIAFNVFAKGKLQGSGSEKIADLILG